MLTNKLARPALGLARGLLVAAGALVAMGSASLALAQNAASEKIGQIEFARGAGFAQTPGKTPRTLGKGLPLAQGDRITTADGAVAIVALQDGTRISVRPNSDMVLQNYNYSKPEAQSNSMVLQLLRGGLRTLTGLVAKNLPNAARVVTPTATVGIRGADFDVRLCQKDCAAEVAKNTDRPRPNIVLASAKVVSVDGALTATGTSGQTRTLVKGGSVYPGDRVDTAGNSRAVLAFRDDSRVTLGALTQFRVDNFVFDERNAGKHFFVGPEGVRPLSDSPINDLPRPDGVAVDKKPLFGVASELGSDRIGEGDPGLFIYVRNGHIELLSGASLTQLGRGEAGFAATDGGAVGRPFSVPRFFDLDRTPLPSTRNPALSSFLDELDLRSPNQCQ